MLVLDSMGGSNTIAVNNIRLYLREEWKAKMKDQDQTFADAEIEVVAPMKPEQDNYTDCGIYLLEYVERMFKIYNR